MLRFVLVDELIGGGRYVLQALQTFRLLRTSGVVAAAGPDSEECNSDCALAPCRPVKHRLRCSPRRVRRDIPYGPSFCWAKEGVR